MKWAWNGTRSRGMNSMQAPDASNRSGYVQALPISSPQSPPPCPSEPRQKKAKEGTLNGVYIYDIDK